ncbi:hypothetical protein [Streptomyces sp. CB01881]|uniref:hypothetical protein n=1 Tax=Streptomyces sp. CB01881 TaxID=2078691 RepID=UPI000CDC841B|nr:hypothetical protein [Streptomyces sp. CB01881]AUY50593.1 hypothetical protein C2142_18445 [Streptomyces sp. CB01881]TYC73981.1 hypothetical protein EH183_18425 [Streptomyces sp. CB01881]
MTRAARPAAAAGLVLAAVLGLAACGGGGSGKAAGGAAACDGVVATDRAGALLDDGAAPAYKLDKQLDAAQQPGLQLLGCTAEAAKGLGLSVRLTGSETPGGGLKGPEPQPGEPVYSLGFGDRSQVTRWGARLTFRCDGTYAKSGKPLYFTAEAAPYQASGPAPQSPAARWTPEAWARLATDSARRAAGGVLGCTAPVAWPSGEPALSPATAAPAPSGTSG